jgi:hypothetical protein
MSRFGFRYGQVKHAILALGKRRKNGFTVDDVQEVCKGKNRHSIAMNLYKMWKGGALKRVEESKRGRNGSPAVYALV